MKTNTKVYLRVYLGGHSGIGNEIELGIRWKTVIKNDNYHLEFEDSSGNWWPDYMLIVVTTTEYINECSNISN